MMAVLMMIQSGKVQQQDIENVASPYMDYTVQMKNSFEHLEEIIRETENDNCSS